MHAKPISRFIPVSVGALIAALAMTLLLAAPTAAAETLTSVLLGSEEVPGPGDSDGSGVAIVDVDAVAETLCYSVSASAIDAPTAAHIHEGADGVAGPVVVTLTTPTGSDPYTSDACAANPGDYDLVASGDPDVAALLADIEANPQNYYVNVHTAAFPAGAVRGQLGLQGPASMAASYINPDTGAATENPNVDPASECETPDQFDTQEVSPAGTVTNNVHNDACLFDALGFDVDAQVSFESSGVGVISGCPDPDAAGPKTATNTGTLCTLTGYQETGMPGDLEYHARVNSEVSGTQTVVFCADPEGNGCADATLSDTITVVWSGPAAAAASYINPDTGAATENPDVDPASECETPDQADTQQVSPAGSTANNVHNDACLFDAGGFDVDAQVSFESSGVGVISGCPDPDAGGMKTATNTGTLCTLTGYQETGMPGDLEYHARVNSEVSGTQTVVFCADPEGNGCGDATISDSITVTWVAAAVAPTPTPTASGLPNTTIEAGGDPIDGTVLAVAFAALGLGSMTFMGYRTLATRRAR